MSPRAVWSGTVWRRGHGGVEHWAVMGLDDIIYMSDLAGQLM